MANLKNPVKQKLEHLLNMRSGYVLEFINATFQGFFFTSVAIDVDGKYPDGSKAARLRSFWKSEADSIVATLMLEKLERWRTNQLMNGGTSPAGQEIYDDALAELHALVLDDSTPTADEIGALEIDLGTIDQAHGEIGQQRGVIKELTSRNRDIDESNHRAEVFQRIHSESTTLEQRWIKLDADKRALAQKLTAARESARFLDRQLGDLEVHRVDRTLCDPAEAP
ncbi:hypothetical protein [Mycobacterium paraintracellulare]|uniref:Uncharacterized protein n=1 Tax=Mycobacterium paraintracellulare TaxID=1138383 RepID=A0ABN6ANB5_9MYCO|nr:hypothetical protein [Mycobacterium paraintracellulare]BBY70391.1 hypothetical protein MPRI_25780 [Mycobacterium paraintracellulare]